MADNAWTDLIQAILTHLPVRTVLKCHTLSGEYNSWLTSQEFLKQYSMNHSQASWLAFSKPEFISSYDPELDSWCKLPNLHLNAIPLASSRGLICTLQSGNGNLRVGNPVTGARVPVPTPHELSRFFFLVVGMFTSQSRFKIVVAGSELISEDSIQFKLETCVFDSRTYTWTKGSSTSIPAPITSVRASDGFGKLFVVVGRHYLLCYDIEFGLWHPVTFPVNGQLSSVKLVNRPQNLVLVGRTDDGRIRLWEYRTREIWHYLDTMPECFHEELLQSGSRRFACVGDGDVVYFSGTKCERILVYRLSSRSWKWAASCTHVTKNPHYDMLQGICIEPRLDTSPYCNPNLVWIFKMWFVASCRA